MENISLKLYDDKITLTQYDKIVRRWGYFDDWRKVNYETGELKDWTFADHKRVAYNQRLCRVRAINKIYDISDRNQFSYFLTITLNPDYVDRSDPVAVHALYKRIIKRLKYRYKGIAYLSVPEFHADRLNMHYHIMINFTRRPKLKFSVDNWNRFGIKSYTIADKFRKRDCFLVVEKLENNNPGYLVKYMTKGCEKPMARRYSCSRNLDRQRVQESARLSDHWRTLAHAADKLGFQALEIGSLPCYVLDRKDTRPRGACAAAADLSSKYTKGEIFVELKEIYDKILAAYAEAIKPIDEMTAIDPRTGAEKQKPCESVQLSYLV